MEGSRLTGLPESVPSVRHLHLGFGESIEPLEYLLGLLPNVTSMSLDIVGLGTLWDRFLAVLRAMQTLKKSEIVGYIDISDDQLRALMDPHAWTLQELRIPTPDLTNFGFSAIGRCTALRHLYLWQADRFENLHLEQLVPSVPGLETMHLRLCHALSGAGSVPLHYLGNLRELCFEYSGIDNNALRGLGRIQTLQHLNLMDSQVDVEVLRSLIDLKDLRTLKLSVIMDGGGLDIICENFKRLETLDVGNCEKLTDAGGLKLRRLENLRSLRIVRGVDFKDETFERGFGSRSMEEIMLGACSLTDDGVASIALHHNRLKILRLH